MRFKGIAVVLALAAGRNTSLAAQRARLVPSPSILFRPARETPTDSLHLTRTYWKEGALALGVPMGVLGAVAVRGLCEDSDTPDPNCARATLAGAVLGFLIGAVPGALIGGAIPKHE